MNSHACGPSLSNADDSRMIVQFQGVSVCVLAQVYHVYPSVTSSMKKTCNGHRAEHKLAPVFNCQIWQTSVTTNSHTLPNNDADD